MVIGRACETLHKRADSAGQCLAERENCGFGAASRKALRPCGCQVACRSPQSQADQTLASGYGGRCPCRRYAPGRGYTRRPAERLATHRVAILVAAIATARARTRQIRRRRRGRVRRRHDRLQRRSGRTRRRLRGRGHLDHASPRPSPSSATGSGPGGDRPPSSLHREYVLYAIFNVIGLLISLACLWISHDLLGAWRPGDLPHPARRQHRETGIRAGARHRVPVLGLPALRLRLAASRPAPRQRP